MNSKQLLLAVSYLGLCALSQQASAACNIGSENRTPQKLNLDMGAISVDPKLPVGGVISARHFSLNSARLLALQCDSSGGSIKGMIEGSSFTQLANVYRTNIKGVGIRFSLDDQQINFPYQAPVGADKKVLGQQLKVELIKTDMLTGAGILTEAMTTRYYLDGDGPNHPILTAQFQANSTVLNNPTCGFSPESIQQTVQMQPIKAAQLTAVGQTAAAQNFTVGFSCAPGYTAKTIEVKFHYQSDHHAPANNVLKNLSQTGSDAQGVGIALYFTDFNNYPLDSGGSIIFSGYEHNFPQVRIRASYYQTLPQVIPGSVYATMMMNMTYQ